MSDNLAIDPKQLAEWREYADRRGSDISVESIQFKLAEMVWTLCDALTAATERANTAQQERDALKWEADGQCGHCGEDAVRVSVDTAGYPYEVYAVRYCPVCHNAWVREEPVGPDADVL